MLCERQKTLSLGRDRHAPEPVVIPGGRFACLAVGLCRAVMRASEVLGKASVSKPQKRECSCQDQPQRGCVILRPTLTRPLTWPLARLSTQSGRRYDTSSVLESGSPPNDANLVIPRPGSPFDCSKTAVGSMRPSLEVGPRNEHLLHHLGKTQLRTTDNTRSQNRYHHC